MDLVDDGTLVIVKRPPHYVERRSDGYVEPEVVYIVGTAHMSRLSADQVTRVINSVHPDNVVIELCRSRHVRLTFISCKNVRKDLYLLMPVYETLLC